MMKLNNSKYRSQRVILLMASGLLLAFAASSCGKVESDAAIEVASKAESAPIVEEQSRPNVIVILADDMRAGYTGFEGHPVIETPNIDSLAA